MSYFLDPFRRHCFTPRGVIHVGAHKCEEREQYNTAGVTDEHILWIEANPDLVRNITETMSPQVRILQGLISDTDDVEVSFMITNNMQSSSIYELDQHKRHHPEIVEVARQTLRTVTLPTLLRRNNIAVSDFDMLVMDIQGAEFVALQGATDILCHFHWILLEVNDEELYKGIALSSQIESYLELRGFYSDFVFIWWHCSLQYEKYVTPCVCMIFGDKERVMTQYSV